MKRRRRTLVPVACVYIIGAFFLTAPGIVPTASAGPIDDAVEEALDNVIKCTKTLDIVFCVLREAQKQVPVCVATCP